MIDIFNLIKRYFAALRKNSISNKWCKNTEKKMCGVLFLLTNAIDKVC